MFFNIKHNEYNQKINLYTAILLNSFLNHLIYLIDF
jgi:hypothetical protein